MGEIRMDALKNRKITVIAVLLALSATHESRGISAYLKQIGPAPLRFSLTTPVPASLALPVSLIEREAPTNSPSIDSPAETSDNTNAIVAPPEAVSAPPPKPVVMSAESPANDSANPPASDLLPVSPQMLTEYFKPVTEGTNSAGEVSVPVPVGFTPPSPQPSSRATYHSP